MMFMLTLLVVAGTCVHLRAAQTCGTCPTGPVDGSIHPNAIQIDGTGTGTTAAAQAANLFVNTITSCTNSAPNNVGVKNAGATVDWVKDCAANTDAPALCGSVAFGIDPTGACTGGIPTGAVGGTGHWNGVRIVDAVDGNDHDIFLTGGKENDVSTWNIGPGSIGSSKYDFTQGYLANNQTYLFAGFERMGNNGTTAFDIEFNQNAPPANSPFPGYIPTRTPGDVLFTFEAQGSGTSGSVTPHYFTWDLIAGSNPPAYKYTEHSFPSAVYTSINNSTTMQGAPWGHVDGKGNWVLGVMDRFTFAEVAVPLSIMPGVNACGGTAFVQFRTRSSATDTSDMKDATKIFQYSFGGPQAKIVLTPPVCPAQTFGFDGTTSLNSAGNGNTGLTYAWMFTVDPTTVTMSGGGTTPCLDAQNHPIAGCYTSTSASGTVTLSGVPAGTFATITADMTVTDSGNCTDDATPKTVQVFNPPASPAPSLSTGCTAAFHFEGGLDQTGFSNTWTFTVDNTNVTLTGLNGLSLTAGANGSYTTTTADNVLSGDVQVNLPQGTYSVGINSSLAITASATGSCPPTAPGPTNITVRAPVTAAAAKNTVTAPDSSLTADAAFVMSVKATTNVPAADSPSFQWQSNTGTQQVPVWTNIDTSVVASAQGATMDLDLPAIQTLGVASDVSFTINEQAPSNVANGFYVGKVWGLQLRVVVSRTVDTTTCTKASDPIVVKATKALDP
jgi:hypothetical protein